MLITNILLGIIIFLLVIIFGSIATIERRLTLIEYTKMGGLFSKLMGRGRKVKDDKAKVKVD